LTTVLDGDLELAGAILRHAEVLRDSGSEKDGRIALFAEHLAYVVASGGIVAGCGWLEGVWYVGGNTDRDGLTMHAVTLELQGLLGVEYVTTATAEAAS
jgi:hypothetical protein